jgi:hypothetical protein
MSYMKLTVPKPIYERRLARMAELIAMKAPGIIIYHEARMIQEAYRPNLWHRLVWWFQSTRVGLWWTMLGYEVPVFEDDFDGMSAEGWNRLVAELVKPEPKLVGSYDADTHSCTLCRCLWGVYNEGCACDCHE